MGSYSSVRVVLKFHTLATCHITSIRLINIANEVTAIKTPRI